MSDAEQLRAKVVCGVCGRLLDRLRYSSGASRPYSQWVVATYQPTPDGGFVDTREIPKPSNVRAGTMIYAVHRGIPRVGQLRYECHRRCGAVHVLRLERVTAAMQAGKTRIVAGVDI
jgi:hypothetical protein